MLVHDVALAILDVQMPEMDGFELAELMSGAERTRTIPIIFVTAGAIDSQRHFRGYEMGAVDFLFKPIDPHILAARQKCFSSCTVKGGRLLSSEMNYAEPMRDCSTKWPNASAWSSHCAKVKNCSDRR